MMHQGHTIFCTHDSRAKGRYLGQNTLVPHV
ncbi:hypothetical protein LOKVESSMR4R_03767 [Yoonia vestfoldensis]|jgi:hypothetical protein|uniref:Uncharacterized protein n=1 Tax=Yoonia vestfoldensis TaxID=245188 RepID=A0A1Y0EIB3_9RHOB|nr:hypothetical protein LOKVESSMR4R_03767 [Yoonia vestfoldensis]